MNKQDKPRGGFALGDANFMKAMGKDCLIMIVASGTRALLESAGPLATLKELFRRRGRTLAALQRHPRSTTS
ncbi:hypothetical protein MMC12_006733 [Toensbergia leucococca]|nr:hypothetical protein [Toensbergia leucococca]